MYHVFVSCLEAFENAMSLPNALADINGYPIHRSHRTNQWVTPCAQNTHSRFKLLRLIQMRQLSAVDNNFLRCIQHPLTSELHLFRGQNEIVAPERLVRIT